MFHPGLPRQSLSNRLRRQRYLPVHTTPGTQNFASQVPRIDTRYVRERTVLAFLRSHAIKQTRTAITSSEAANTQLSADDEYNFGLDTESLSRLENIANGYRRRGLYSYAEVML